MSGPFGSSQWMYQSAAGFYPTEIGQSLRFNDDDLARLSRTPASAGNRKTWTWSGWVKRGNLGTFQGVITGDSQYELIRFNTNDTIKIRFNNTDCDTNAVFRDVSAWYHILWVVDSTDATSANRNRLYVNGVEQTFSSSSYVAQNTNSNDFNNTVQHRIGQQGLGGEPYDGYMAEVNFIDGQALDPTDFGEFKSGVWVAKEYTGSYGTNGFYLPFKQTTLANGMNTVTYTGNGATQSIEGVGFSPDLVWVKSRSLAVSGTHSIHDTVRGVGNVLFPNLTNAESTGTRLNSFDSDGFTLNSVTQGNGANETFVAWCWDAGSGSPASNTDGSITSTVKANPAYGFSVVSYTGNGSTGATVGHGLGVAPKMMIIKNRDISDNWAVYHYDLGATHGINLNATTAAFDWDRYWNDTAPTSSVFTVGGPIVDAQVNGSGNDIIAYCFAEISGYSSISSYSGTGASGNTITTGFKPAFVMIKGTSADRNWLMYDSTRDADTSNVYKDLGANTSSAEQLIGTGTNELEFTDTGFVHKGSESNLNASGETYIYMAFADTRDAAFWRDLSGNDNTWQPNALQNSDVMPDSPTNNFAVLNLLDTNAAVFSEGNLKASDDGSNGWNITRATFGLSSGKWYWEMVPTAIDQVICASIATKDATLSNLPGQTHNFGVTYYDDGNLYKETSGPTGYGAAYTVGDVIGVALDMDAGSVTFYKNGASQGVASSNLLTYGDTWFPASGTYFNNTSQVFNFGQDSSFAGNKTAQGNTDANGVGDFYHSVPSGFLALAAQNLPDPVIDPAQDDVPSDYFNTVTWSGTGSVQSITGVGFQPDFFWGKQRNANRGHILQDVVRGTTKVLNSHNTNAEVTSTAQVTSFDADGFTLGTDPELNAAGGTHVGWNWLAGNGTSSNTDGSITSTVSVNQKAGFSIVSWAGNETAGATVGHGLGVAPEVIIVKRRSDASSWNVYHKYIASDAETDVIYLDLTNAATDDNTRWNDTAPTSSVFTLGANDAVNGASMIAYCFAEVEGYSKFGSYTGNGSTTDGPFIFTGFRPAFVMVKRTDVADSWVIKDATREPYNDNDRKSLYPNLSIAEDTTGYPTDFLSNGFKHRNNASSENNSGGTYIFAAFAEMPFRYSNAR